MENKATVTFLDPCPEKWPLQHGKWAKMIKCFQENVGQKLSCIRRQQHKILGTQEGDQST